MADEEEIPSDCPFSVFVAVGDGLWTKGHFRKALVSYSKVRYQLHFSPPAEKQERQLKQRVDK